MHQIGDVSIKFFKTDIVHVTHLPVEHGNEHFEAIRPFLHELCDRLAAHFVELLAVRFITEADLQMARIYLDSERGGGVHR